MLKTLSAVLLVCIPCAAAAQEIAPFVGAHGATTPGSYVSAAADAPGQLDLWPDQSFHLSSGATSHAGRWHADPARGGLVLDLGGESLVFEVRNSQRLRPGGASDDGSQDLVLSETFFPGPIRLPVSGMLTYFADAATIVHCATGRTYPIAQEGDYPELEQAYLENRPGPTEPVFVTMDAMIAVREQMDGPDRLTMVAEAFGSAFPGEDCSLGNRTLDLHHAVWTITALGGIDLEPTDNLREPFMLCDTNAQTVVASVGCNTMRGGFSTSGSDLSFSQGMASTMMACPDPLSTWELRLGEVLANVTGFEIGGRSMRLLDADGARLAELRAVYLP